MSALRDHSILLHIIRYCDQIEETMELSWKRSSQKMKIRKS